MLDVVLANEIGGMVGEVHALVAQDLIHAGCFVKDYCNGPHFVIDAEARLEQVRERAMTDIVQHRGSQEWLACRLNFLIRMLALEML